MAIRWLGALLLGISLVGCAAEDPEAPGIMRAAIVFDGAHVIDADRGVDGALVVVGGTVTIEPDGRVAGPTYMLAGDVDVAGRIDGDVALLGGELTVTRSGVIGGDLARMGGGLERDPASRIDGQLIEGPPRPALRPAPTSPWWVRILRSVINGTVVAIAALLLVRFLPRPAEHVGEAATRHPAVSGAIGLLAGVVSLVVLVLMAFTVLLIPVSIAAGFLLLAALAYGWIGLGSALGARLRRRWPAIGSAPRAAFAGTFAVMLVLDALGTIPVIGDAVAILIMVVGFGAVLLTRFGLRRFIPRTGAQEA